MQSDVVCVNFCGVGVLPASMEGQRRLRKSMGCCMVLYAILVHERAYAWRTTAQGNDCLNLRTRGLLVWHRVHQNAKMRPKTELATVRH